MTILCWFFGICLSREEWMLGRSCGDWRWRTRKRRLVLHVRACSSREKFTPLMRLKSTIFFMFKNNCLDEKTVWFETVANKKNASSRREEKKGKLNSFLHKFIHDSFSSRRSLISERLVAKRFWCNFFDSLIDKNAEFVTSRLPVGNFRREVSVKSHLKRVCDAQNRKAD